GFLVSLCVFARPPHRPLIRFLYLFYRVLYRRLTSDYQRLVRTGSGKPALDVSHSPQEADCTPAKRLGKIRVLMNKVSKRCLVVESQKCGNRPPVDQGKVIL